MDGKIEGWTDGYLGLLKVEESRVRLTKQVQKPSNSVSPPDGVKGIPGAVLERYWSQCPWIFGSHNHHFSGVLGTFIPPTLLDFITHPPDLTPFPPTLI